MPNQCDDVFRALGREVQVQFVDQAAAELIHDDLVFRYGSGAGLRDPHSLASALARTLQQLAYEPGASIPSLAARLASGVIQNHPLVDGNERTGFALMLAFLGQNGFELRVSPADALNAIRDRAADTMSEDEFVRWAERHSVAQVRPLRTKKRKSSPSSGYEP